MGVLAEYLRSEAEQLRAEVKGRKEALEEWKKALENLYNRMATWLHEADGGLNLLWAGDRTEEYISEPRLGSYGVNILTIGIGMGHRQAYVFPRARYVAASIKPPGREMRRADGMAEIRYGVTAEYYLFRWVTDAGDEWFIQNVSEWNRPKEYGTVEPLDRDRFEAAILHVLQ